VHKHCQSFYHYTNAGHNSPEDFCRCQVGYPSVDLADAVEPKDEKLKIELYGDLAALLKLGNDIQIAETANVNS
tara:strand:+ start:125 stop:346 length:222 start_codon:yes stop_codon:yes gene_type:complete